MSKQAFNDHFYKEYNELAQLIDGLSATINSVASESEQKILFSAEYEKISNRFEILQKYFTENIPFIPNYEVRKARNTWAN